MSPSVNAVEVRNLERTYNGGGWFQRSQREKINAIKNINLCIGQGEIFGLLGPNGAGKTTFVKILSTELMPSSGVVNVLGFDVTKEYRKIRPRINVVSGGDQGLYPNLSGLENLKYFSLIYKLNSSKQNLVIESLLERVGLNEASARRRVSDYSKGMRQRLHIAKGLLNNPDLILMDEPSLGLDPEASKKFRALIRSLREDGKTILLTTHYLSEAEELCDRLAIINEGRIVTSGSMSELAANVSQSHSRFTFETGGQCCERLMQDIEMLGIAIEGTAIASAHGDGWIVSGRTRASFEEFNSRINQENKIKIRSMSFERPTLEDLYFDTMGSMQA